MATIKAKDGKILARECGGTITTSCCDCTPKNLSSYTTNPAHPNWMMSAFIGDNCDGGAFGNVVIQLVNDDGSGFVPADEQALFRLRRFALGTTVNQTGLYGGSTQTGEFDGVVIFRDGNHFVAGRDARVHGRIELDGAVGLLDSDDGGVFVGAE